VRGQDVWLARGVEQTDRILRCIQCNAPARSLAELTLHMVHSKHYINIVGPSTSSSSSNVTHSFHPPKTSSRDKPTDVAPPRLKNGLRISEHTDSRREHHADDRTRPQSRSTASSGEQLDGDRKEKDKDAGLDGVAGCAALDDGQRRGTGTPRAAAFSVRNLIATTQPPSTDDGGPSCTRPRSATAHRGSMTSSVAGPEVTSSSDGRVATVAE